MNIDSLVITDLEVQAEHRPNRQLLDLDRLREEVEYSDDPIPSLREAIDRAGRELDNRYKQNLKIKDIVEDRAMVIDEVLRLAWSRETWPDPDDISLVAVGGYGRKELLPYSDIDLLFLTRKDRHGKYKEAISAFLTLLWDIGLKVGQSVRSIKQCRQEAARDLTIVTTLMESRTLMGGDALRLQMLEAIKGRRIWPIKKFLKAKLEEQEARHKKYHDIDYALEPNVKNSPGGLRDIQTIFWVAQRQYGASTFADLVKLGFLTPSEEALLKKGRQFLWKLRYGLHYLEGRCEDRLLFDKQRELAKLFGYEDDDTSLGVEKLMQQYYRVVANLRGLNDVLLQNFDEAILRADEKDVIKPLNRRFQIHNDYIEVVSRDVFQKYPFALLEVFVLMAQHAEIKGIRASTIRLLRDSRRLIKDDFRHDIRNITLFMELLRSPHQLTLQLRRMARYGILGRYLPEFGAISGKMQHDLFHIYTVDAHTLQVVENMRRLLLPEAEATFPLAARVARTLPKPELLYLGGLYHDIAKGRGGDHSELGQIDAENFCRRHRINEWDTRLVAWLVKHHLMMSMTAQRKDISDPEVIREFATQVGDQTHLDYLYTMTVADIRATNPDLWNSWRGTLLRQLYENTSHALSRGLEHTVDREERIDACQHDARALLHQAGLADPAIDRIWEQVDDEYFVREPADAVAWQTQSISEHKDDAPLIAIRELDSNNCTFGATQVFIYTRNASLLFANSTAAFEELGLDIQGARIFSSRHGYCMDTYTVLEASGTPVGNRPERYQEIQRVLRRNLERKDVALTPARIRRTRVEKYFHKPIEISLRNLEREGVSTLELNCPDQPGILACVGKILAEHQISVQDARITTLGERVEDLFYIRKNDGDQVDDPDQILRLQQDIQSELEQRLTN